MHQQIVSTDRAMKNIAADIGERLIQKKAALKHGEFIPWVEKHCAFTPRMAQQYIRIAKAKYETRFAFEACTSIREVLALGKTAKEPKQSTRAATLNDLRKVERLRALRDDPSASEGEKENAQANCRDRIVPRLTSDGRQASVRG